MIGHRFKFQEYFDLVLLKNFRTELFFEEHFGEVRQRGFQSLILLFFIIGTVFLNIKDIVKILENPVESIRFFQSSPGEYFVSTLKIAFYGGFLFSIPFLLGQLICFFLPGLTNKEGFFIMSLLGSSLLLFLVGLIFSYFILIPAALNFFLNYSLGVIDPLWSFDEYFNFVLVLFFSTGVIFQIPIVQVILSLSKILSGQTMLQSWKYILLFSTFLGAVLTPSADPLTQLLLSGAVFFLYLFGSYFSIFLTKSTFLSYK